MTRSTKVRTLKGSGIFTRIKEAFQSAAIFGTNPVTALALYCWHFVKDGVKEFYALATEGLTYEDMEHRVIYLIGIVTALISMAIIWPSTIWLIVLIPVAFIQNMFFTLVSRSRNSQDTEYHRYCAWGSNGVWFLCQIMIVKNIWTAINAGQWWYALLAGVVYALATTEGSVLMMKRLIKSESGKRRVGANDKARNCLHDLDDRIQVLERMINTKVTESVVESNAIEAMKNAVVHNHNPMIMGFTGPPELKEYPGTVFDGTDDHIDLPAPEVMIEIKPLPAPAEIKLDGVEFGCNDEDPKMTPRAKGFDEKAGDEIRKRNPDRK